MRDLLHSGARFLIIGAISTLIELASFNLFLLVFGWDVVPAKVVSSLIALVNAYIGNREWAFRHRKGASRWSELGLFLLVNAFCTGLGAAILGVGAAVLGAEDPLLINAVNVVSIGIVVLVRFSLYHYVVFRGAALPGLPPARIEGSAGEHGERPTVV